MTFKEAADPSKWSDGWRWIISGIVVAVLAVIGSAASTGLMIGSYREQFTELSGKMTQVITEQQLARDGLAKAHEDAKDAADAAKRVAADLALGRGQNLPRIDRLEDAVGRIIPDLAQIKQLTADIKDTTGRHDEDIKAIRDAVAPRSSHSR